MKTLNKILETVLGLLVAVMVLGCIWQVITRFVLNNPSKYTEELLRYLLIWTNWKTCSRMTSAACNPLG